MRAVMVALGMTCLLLADDPGRQKVQVSNTQRLDFPSGGVLHLKNTTGELSVEGWDRPDMEITTMKSTRDFYDSQDRDKASRELDRVRITAEPHGDEDLVTTTFPKRRSFPMV